MKDSANTSPASSQSNSQSYAEQIRQRRMARRAEAELQTAQTEPKLAQQPQVSQQVQSTPPVREVQEQPIKQAPVQLIPPQQPSQQRQPNQQQQPQATAAQQQQQYYQQQQQEQYYAGDVNIPGIGLEESMIAPGMYKPLQEEVVLQWIAPSRPHKKKNRQFFSTVAIIALLVSLILFFAGQFLPIAVVISIAFLVYVLSVIPPQNVTNRITTHGIRSDEAIYYWEEMGMFWFSKKFDQTILHVEVARFPGRLSLLLGTEDPETVQLILSDVLLQGKPRMTAMEKSAEWLQKKIPLDTD